MADSVGQLPPRPSPLPKDRGMLPPLPATPAAEPVPAGPPVTEAYGRAATSPAAAPATMSFEERLVAVTAAGGLTALPADFGDPQGDWTTVRFDSPFTILYLDGRQADQVTPEMTARHRELLQRFWQEKLRSMSQGAARLSILKKYGGPEESERLVRSYPDIIERAYEQLATRGAIDATHRRIVAKTEAVVFARVDDKLDDFLVDGVLQPAEVEALLDFGEREGLQRPAIAERVHDHLRIKGFLPESEPYGHTREARLLSTAWMQPRRSPAATVFAVAVPVPETKSLLLPLFVFSFVVVTVLLIASAVRGSRSFFWPETRTDAVTGTTSTHADSTALTATVSTVSQAPVPDATTLAIETEPPPMDTGTTVSVVEPPPPPVPVVSVEERRRVREDLASIRESVDSDPQAGLDRAAFLQQSLGKAWVEERIELAQLQSDLEKALLTQQMRAEQERMRLETEERARAERDREWERRLAAVEELMKQSNYSGAKALADQLLASPDIPPSISERAGGLREQALAELQKIFSSAKVKSKTGRTPRRQP